MLCIPLVAPSSLSRECVTFCCLTSGWIGYKSVSNKDVPFSILHTQNRTPQKQTLWDWIYNTHFFFWKVKMYWGGPVFALCSWFRGFGSPLREVPLYMHDNPCCYGQLHYTCTAALYMYKCMCFILVQCSSPLRCMHTHVHTLHAPIHTHHIAFALFYNSQREACLRNTTFILHLLVTCVHHTAALDRLCYLHS